MILSLNNLKRLVTPERFFMISVLLVNGGNYLYNLILGRFLGPEKFADAAILITFLLVLSFIAMTFQLVTAKFSVTFTGKSLAVFLSLVYKYTLLVSIIMGTLVVVFSNALHQFFNTSTPTMFVIFGFGVPFYFLMSVNRGYYQGRKKFVLLSYTYQLEMASRLIITLGLLYVTSKASAIVIAFGILCSFIIGLFPFKLGNVKLFKKAVLDASQLKLVKRFFIITAFYELTQIIINNSDILLVKHYFDAHNAGLYASLALVGRVVYFIAWMFVMLLLPKVVELKKEGQPTAPILLKYVIYIAGIAALIISVCYFFPTFIIDVLFGNAYIEIAPLLWRYALATGIFAVSNIFAYYYLSLDYYLPVVVSGVFGMLQIVLIICCHQNLAQVVNVQILAMVLLFVMQLAFFFTNTYKSK